MKWLAGILLLITIGLGTATWLGGHGPTRAHVPTYRVTKAELLREVEAEGYLKAVKATPITAPPSDAPLKIAWLAPDGSVVREGDVVVRFDETVFRKQLDQGQANRSSADVKIAKEKGAVNAAIRNRRRAASVALAERTQAQTFAPKDEDIFSRQQIIESQIDLGLADARLGHAQASETVELELSRNKVGLLNVERKSADLEIGRARRVLGALEVKAPHDGIIVMKKAWRGETIKVGDTVWPGHPIAEIPHLGDMEAEVFVLEADAAGLADGKPAKLTVESRPDLVLTAKVSRVDRIAKPLDPKIPIKYFTTNLGITGSHDGGLKPGARVRAKLALGQLTGLVVPRHAIMECHGRRCVFRKDGAVFVTVKVKLGEGTPGRVVVAEGLREGDEIALRDPTDDGKSSSATESPGAKRPGAAP